MNDPDEVIAYVKTIKVMFRELLKEGLTKAEFEECISDLEKVGTAGARVMIRLIRTHLDSLE